MDYFIWKKKKMKSILVLFVLVAVVAAQGGFPGRRDSRDSRNSRDSRPSRESRDSRDSDERRRPGFPNQNQNSGNGISFNGRPTLGCGLSCSTSASFTTNIDGTTTTARCTDTGANAADRCPGCCKSVALAAGLSSDRAAGFPSNNGRSCVCCIRSC